MELIKRETAIVLISTAVAIGIITIFAFFIVWICFPVATPKDSFKDALGFASGLFGGLATFGAAVVAAHLFNDWKEQHNKMILANEAKTAFKKLSNSFLLLATYRQTIKRMSGQNATSTVTEVRDSFRPLIDFNQDIAVHLKYFEDLANLSRITPLILQYNNCINKHLNYMNGFYSNPQNQHISQPFIDNCTEFTEEIAPITHSIKEILIDYILVREAFLK